jgi:glutaminase
MEDCVLMPAYYPKVFEEIAEQVNQLDDIGEVASYIPELKSIDPDKFGIHLAMVDGQHFGYGDSDEKFSIQSISKVLSLVAVLSPFARANMPSRCGAPSSTPKAIPTKA